MFNLKWDSWDYKLLFHFKTASASLIHVISSTLKIIELEWNNDNLSEEGKHLLQTTELQDSVEINNRG